MEPQPLQLEQVSGTYDPEYQILYVTYRGYITGEITTQVYMWMRELIETYGLSQVRGSIFDFREVANFVVGNLSMTQYQSYQLNNQVDLSDHPVALLVSNIYQRAMVKAALNVTPQQERKRIVHSMEGAYAFIQDWQHIRREAG